MAFIDDSYLLGNESAKNLFGKVNGLPVVDPHNHANVQEIAENKTYPDPWQLFAATDHYVWEVLRKRGVPERYITGDAIPEEKWMKMSEVFPEIAGNPVYEWIHLDLKRYLGITDILGPANGKRIWDAAIVELSQDANRPQNILDRIGVEVMCSTDDPIDLLEEHAKVNSMMGRKIIRPTWRPDKVMNIGKNGWLDYIEKLGERFGMDIKNIDQLVDALRASHDYFAENGCKSSDHGVYAPFAGTSGVKEAAIVMESALKGAALTDEEVYVFSDYIFGKTAEFDSEKGWVFQVHMGAVRDVRASIFNSLGPDSGGDVSNHFIDILTPLRDFLNSFDSRLKVVLYCLDQSHQATLATLARAFGKDVRLGSAWWLCDTPCGMKRQLEYIGSVDLFANFAGMVSDSRKLLSYGSRFEMFRRVLCDVMGSMTEMGQMPGDVAENLVQRMCYDEPKKFFGI